MKKKELLQRVIDLEKEVELLKDKISVIMKNNSAPYRMVDPDPWRYSRPIGTGQGYPNTERIFSGGFLDSQYIVGD